MFNLQMTSLTMKLLGVVSVCLATWCEITFGHQKGASPKPYVTIRDQTKDWALLQCEVLGASPKPKVEWQDDAGNKLPAEEPQVTERGGSYDIVLHTTVTKTDEYRCVVTQEEINHQTKAEIHVHIKDPEPNKGLSTAWIVAVSLPIDFLVAVAVLVAVLVAKGCITLNCKKGPQSETDRDGQRDSSHSDNLIQKA